MTSPAAPPIERTPLTAAEFYQTYHVIREEIAKVVVGQELVVERLLVAMFAGGHVLLTGLPGLGRTLLVKTLAEVLGLDYRRLQFTPDLLPSDIVGAEVLEHDKAAGTRNFRFFKGPVFANLVLVDEINRSPTRTQSALLEVMQERQVTSAGQTFSLPRPFTLIATENTLDNEGVWPLGEAQIDRFMMSIEQTYPTGADERQIVARTTGVVETRAQVVASPEIVLEMQALVRDVPVPPSVCNFALSIVRASRPGEVDAAKGVEETVRLGASPRAAQALLMGAKVLGLARGRSFASRQDVMDLVEPVLLDRLLMNVKAADAPQPQEVVKALIAQARQQALPARSRWTDRILNTL